MICKSVSFTKFKYLNAFLKYALNLKNACLLCLNDIFEIKIKTIKMEKFSKVKEVISAIEADVEKFYNGGNAAAGTRVRKAMQDLKGLAQEIRTEVTEKKNSDK